MIFFGSFVYFSSTEFRIHIEFSFQLMLTEFSVGGVRACIRLSQSTSAELDSLEHNRISFEHTNQTELAIHTRVTLQ